MVSGCGEKDRPPLRSLSMLKTCKQTACGFFLTPDLYDDADDDDASKLNTNLYPPTPSRSLVLLPWLRRGAGISEEV